MRRRCYKCKCLEEESTFKFANRTKNDLNEKFFCKKCLKEGNLETEYKQRKSPIQKPKIEIFNEEFEKNRQIGRFIKRCPQRYRIDYIVPLEKGGKRELKNMKYVSSDGNYMRNFKSFQKRMKCESVKIECPTYTCEGICKISITPPKPKRRSKYRRLKGLRRFKEFDFRT